MIIEYVKQHLTGQFEASLTRPNPDAAAMTNIDIKRAK
jgi:hypothetical protein